VSILDMVSQTIAVRFDEALPHSEEAVKVFLRSMGLEATSVFHYCMGSEYPIRGIIDYPGHYVAYVNPSLSQPSSTHTIYPAKNELARPESKPVVNHAVDPPPPADDKKLHLTSPNDEQAHHSASFDDDTDELTLNIKYDNGEVEREEVVEEEESLNVTPMDVTPL
ncbi:hypothetical protein PFISCL1PPCAC_25873, partial [Pristionchus fissidentatus]